MGGDGGEKGGEGGGRSWKRVIRDSAKLRCRVAAKLPIVTVVVRVRIDAISPRERKKFPHRDTDGARARARAVMEINSSKTRLFN